MRISEIGGEHGLIERIRRNFSVAAGDSLTLGVGDDAALVDLSADSELVVTTDMLVESIHFRHDWSDPYSIGWKAAAVNLSDIAAMGAEPTYAFLSIAFTAEETLERLDRLFDGFVDCLTRYGSRLAGGDTNSAPEHMVISITQIGTVPRGQALRRDTARPGDILLVTGSLGGSAAGLALLEEYGVQKADKIDKDLITLHRRPQPRIVAARAAAGTGKVRAAMDLSDGLLGDAKKLSIASGTGLRIDTASLPITDSVRAAAELLGKDPVLFALTGGEDYELLMAVDPASVDEVTAAVNDAGVALTPVGEVQKSGIRVVALNGVDDLDIADSGWDHFAS
jgi:thiamine-monophosphate kinase